MTFEYQFLISSILEFKWTSVPETKGDPIAFARMEEN